MLLTAWKVVASVVNLAEWLHHEVAFLHEWMRYDKFWGIYFQVVIQQNVDVNDTILVLAVDRFVFPTHLPFNVLSSFQHLVRREFSLAHKACVYETVV